MSVTALDDARQQRVADRIPPSNLEAEMALIGAMIVDAEVADAVEPIIDADDFYAAIHETIFGAIAHLHRTGRPHDLIAVAEELKRRKALERVGGVSYLRSLLESVQTIRSATYYAQIVREKSTLRKLIATGYEIAQLGFEGEVDVRDALATSEQRLRSVTERSLHGDAGTPLEWAMVEAFNALTPDNAPRQNTPWAKVNKMVGGLDAGDLVILSAGPHVGKTGAMLCLSDYVAANFGPTHLYSLEMSKREITQRLWAMYGRLPAKTIRAGNLNEWQLGQISDAYDALKGRKLKIFEQSRTAAKPWTVNDIRAQLARSEEPVKAVFIDYINKLDDPSARTAGLTDNDRLDVIYTQLLRIAAEFQIVLYVIHPVNRKGQEGEPSLKDLKGGGNAEYHAHTVIFLHRAKINGTPDERRQGKIIVAKNRDGDEGYVSATYIGARHLWLEQDQADPWFEPKVEQPELDV